MFHVEHHWKEEVNVLAEITTAIGNIFGVVQEVAAQVMAQPITAMFFVAGLVGMGCGILGRLKRV